ncbi:MAG: right-handed parallel beta-helix repeat-containing protein, partial [Pyrinomonadaceae bacterium]|nr:right-handed parallel beta-helix repeat-containing protein [Pyrinomonadaceae bacterium]
MFRPRFLLTRTAFAAAFVFVLLAAVTATSQTIDFESPTYSIGNINGQDGWSKTGSFDAAVASSGGRTGFGAQSFRISNAVTSGSFGDQTFSKSLLNEAGESTAVNDGMSGGVRQSRFDYQFSIASAVPGAQQPGLAMTISPDRGDGSRMSFLRFEDQADGIHAVFFDYVDVAPFGGANGDVNGCDAGDNFFSTDIATLDRSGIHRIRIVIDFNEGPRNDVVRIYINGELRKTGTSWEDYYRYCAEQNFNQNVRTVDSLLFRASGTAAPATSGAGFLFDNLVGVTTTPTTVTVSPASANNWLFYNDETDTPDTTLTALGTFIAGPGTPPYGTGSAQISVTGTQRRNLATYQFAGTVLSTITDFKYSTYNPSAGNGGSASRSAYVNFNVDFNGTDTWQRRILFLPGDNGTVIQNAWQEWDMINGGNARWRYSGATWPAGVGGGGESGSTAKTWNQILSQYPGVRFRVTDAHFGIRVGEPYADGYTENLDSVTFGTAAGTQIFNFEPSPIKVVDDDGFASITNCDDPAAVAHTTVGSAVTAANAGDTIRICPGTYAPASTVALNKAGLTLTAAEATKPVLQVSGTGYSFLVTAANVTLDNLEIQKTDAGVPSPAHNIIGVQADNFTAQNNLIYGPNPGTTWASNGIVSRAFEVSGGRSGIVIQNNTIHTLRQPGYLNSSSGSITNNVVYGTRGWVVDSGSAFWNFSGNSWGTAENEACDIALIASTVLANYSPLLALSTNNTNAFICSGGIGGQDGRTTAYVDASNTLGGSSLDPYTTIQAGINGALPGGTVNVAAGTYVEDININKTLTVVGAGAASTTISGAIGGDGATVRISANNVEISGFTITREGNNTTDWNNGGLNFGGVAISNLAVTGALIRDNIITGNRTGIDINNSGGHTVRNNVIENNRTGMLFRNQTDNMTVVENSISDNWTVGVLFIDASSGSNVPVQQALGSTFSNNNISGNWYGQIVDRQTGGALPAAGSNLKYFQGNWLGTVAPTIVNTNTTEPGYAGLIPVAFGGTATPPGGQPDIAGEASANFRYQPLLTSGTDTNVETTPGRGTFGFQGAPVVVTSPSADGWAFFTEIANGSGAFVGGPPTPPLGIGSANLTVDATGRQIIGTANYAGTRLDDITHLRYRSHQVSANPAVAPSLQFDMDYDTTDGNTAWQGRLVYEPYMSGTVQQNTWQTWDPLAGMWWSTGAPGNATCPQADPCTWAEVLAAFPNAGIRPPSVNGAVIFKAGGPVGSPLVSHVDGFEIGINTANTTFDFDAGRPTVTIDQAAGQGDPTSDAAIDFTATFSEAVTGFDASDVVISGTAGATTVQITGGPTVYNVAVSGMTGSGTV